ncbi:MAG TPA: phosphotransferase [Enterobacteriaceae bacterium]|nr:phosphotransferase [Enterobacteriaceae bacterium]
MNTHDADIVARDRALPGLNLLLDAEALLAALRTLPSLDRLCEVSVTYLRYKPGTSCVAGLLLHLNDGGTRRYFAKALTVARFQQSWQHPKRQALVAAGDPRAPLALHDKAVMLQHPAFDRGIRYLSLLEDDARLALFGELLPDEPDLPALEWRFLRYKPERRAVIALSRRGVPLGVLRIASKNEYGQILQGSAVGAALGHISLAACKGNRRMLMTCWLEGASLGPEDGGCLAPEMMSAAGVALAQLHQVPFSLPVVQRVEEDIQAMWQVFNALETILPASTTRFQHLARRIARSLTKYPRESVPIHGDFSADQLIKPADGGPLRIIDWDRCACGNPLVDLGSFLARLEMQTIVGLITPRQASEAMLAFLSGYRSQRAVDSRGLLWYSARALLCLAAEPFRRRVADWPQQVERLLTRVNQRVDEAETLSRSEASMDTRLAALCDPLKIGPPLLAALNLPSGYPLPRCRLLRHKPGRRALVEFQLSPSEAVLGKYRHKGMDRHGYQCQMALWRDGFCAPASVVVPEPLGPLPEWQLWLQEKRDAEPMTALLRPDNPDLARSGALVGEALAAVQQSGKLKAVAAAKRWRLSDELAVLARGLEKVAGLYPHWQSRLAAVLADCTALAQTLEGEVPGCAHRDFYPDQVMLSRDRPDQLVLLDFDLCCLSFPALDAGNYLAHVRELALRRDQNINALILHEQAFTQAWLVNSPGISPTSVHQFATLSLVRHIFLSTQFAERTHTTTSLLEVCEQQLRHCFNAHNDREIGL